jgi:hypothetical protein
MNQLSPEVFDVIEALITEKSREIARTEISRAFRRISGEFRQAYVGGRFDDRREADSLLAYLKDVMESAANQI